MFDSSHAWLVAVPSLVSLAAYAVAWCLAVGWVAAVRGGSTRSRPQPRPRSLTILKTLCGADEELERNLRSFLGADHEPLQLVFGAADPFDPALLLVRRLAKEYPRREIAIVYGADPAVPNPKVALLDHLLRYARHDVILLSDSNVRLASGEIARVLPLFDDPRVGMVYQPVVAVGERTVPAAIENLHYTEYAAFLTIGCRLLAGQHTVNAKGQWVRRQALGDVDGFDRVGDRGADDYELSRQVAAAGWMLRAADVPVRVIQRDWSWSSLTGRNLRHAGLRWRICPWAYPLELLFNPIPWALPLAATGRRDLLLVAGGVVVAKALMEFTAARLLRGVPLAARFVPVIPLKDLYIFGCWFVALFARTTVWRGRRYRFGEGGRITPLAAPQPATAPLTIRRAS
ncbi:MAG: glycosyltransferase [Planctomycetia bacterium]